LVAVLAALTLFASGCARTPKGLYKFVNLPASLPAGETNLLGNPSFESPFRMCTVRCNQAWSTEFTTVAAPQFATGTAGRVSGRLAETISYRGRSGDDGSTKSLDRAVELYQSVEAGQATTGGQALTLTLWVSGHCSRCTPFIGIEAFDTHDHWLGEQDQYFQVPKNPMPVQVSWVLPKGTTRVAALLQIPEIYHTSEIDIHVDNALLESRPATDAELTAAARHPKGNG
jgi:hypothetical protein